ncbi:MAG: nitrogen regulation protein NR(II) [Halodesulfurarchaeum sp.]
MKIPTFGLQDTRLVYLVIIALGIVSTYFPIASQLSNLRLASFFGLLEIVWPIGLTVAMLWLSHSTVKEYQHGSKYAFYIPFWALVGWGVTAGLTLLLILHQQSMQGDIQYPLVVISDMAIGGATFGTVIGGLYIANRDRQSQLRTFQKAIEHAGHCVYFTDLDGNIEYVNPAFVETTGYDEDEVIGENASILNSGKHDSEFFEDMWETINNGEVWESEIINQTRSGDLVYADQTIAPVYGDDGEEIERFVAINSDISDLKEYEQRLETRNDQLESLNRVVRHDIRNDMNVIRGWVDLLRDKSDRAEILEITKKLQRSVEHVIELTKSAREYVEALSENDDIPIEDVSLGETLEQVVESRRQTFPDATIEVDDEFPQVTVEANEMLSSVFRNLINNAIQHNDKPDPRVRISADEENGTVTISVVDNGPGIPKALQNELFTKGKQGLESSGSGMGLYLVRRWVSDFRGEITYEENEPEGSVFKIRLEKST